MVGPPHPLPILHVVTAYKMQIGPVVANVKEQTAKTQLELSNLAVARTTTPTNTAANGQRLTHYHSFFSSLLSWENPRASGIAFVSVVLFIFAARYLDILRYVFKITWMTLGITVFAEAVGKAILGTGLTSQFRPRKYYTLPKETLDTLIGDLHELINFFVIETQRVVFAENVFVSAAVRPQHQLLHQSANKSQAFLGAFFSYFLIKVLPFWGLSLLSTFVIFLTPLIYKNNKEVIDHHLAEISNIINQQTEQVKQLASHHAARASDATKQYVGDYSAKAQGLLGSARGRSFSPPVAKKEIEEVKKENALTYKSEDFPAAPTEIQAPQVEAIEATPSELKEEVKEAEPLIAS